MFWSVPSCPTAKICSLIAPPVFWVTSSAKRSQIVWFGEIGVSMDASLSVVGSAPRAPERQTKGAATIAALPTMPRTKVFRLTILMAFPPVKSLVRSSASA